MLLKGAVKTLNFIFHLLKSKPKQKKAALISISSFNKIKAVLDGEI